MASNKNATRLDFNVDFNDVLTNPILDIGARVWEQDRYDAFRTCYLSMRVIDDLVDNRKESPEPISDQERLKYKEELYAWLNVLKKGTADNPVVAALQEILERFRIPLWPWERLARAMLYDLSHDGFASLLVFRRYAEGAAIAPASVFMHLCAVRRQGEGYHEPSFDIRAASKDLALFSYFVHIMRDFQKDQIRNLNYYADTLIARYHLSPEDLRETARSGRANPGVRALLGTYKQIAEYYRRRSRQTLDGLREHLEDRYALSLELIYALYLQIYQRVNPDLGDFTVEELNPSTDEIRAEIERVLAASSQA